MGNRLIKPANISIVSGKPKCPAGQRSTAIGTESESLLGGPHQFPRKQLAPDKVATPKWEHLIKRILHMAADCPPNLPDTSCGRRCRQVKLLLGGTPQSRAMCQMYYSLRTAVESKSAQPIKL